MTHPRVVWRSECFQEGMERRAERRCPSLCRGCNAYCPRLGFVASKIDEWLGFLATDADATGVP